MKVNFFILHFTLYQQTQTDRRSWLKWTWLWAENPTRPACGHNQNATQHHNVYHGHLCNSARHLIPVDLIPPPSPPPAPPPPPILQTLNHKTRVSGVSTLILSGSHVTTTTKSLRCHQRDDKWGALIIKNECDRPICCGYGYMSGN